MDTNKFFSFPRIAMVMKREIMENWKTNLYRLIGIYAGFLLVMVFTMSKQASSYSILRWLFSITVLMCWGRLFLSSVFSALSMLPTLWRT